MKFISHLKRINWKKGLSILIAVFIGLEITLRYAFGFCDAVLLQEDPELEYINQPNQKRFRFGNTIIYNSFSMRSVELDPNAAKILGLGDSFINGGTPTDHFDLATTILGQKISSKCGKPIQFLNVSAGSWGPDNCYNYLLKYGHFDARALILFVSSHDAYDNINFQKVVGVNPSFPQEQYRIAIIELLDRYVLPRITEQSYTNEESYQSLGINKKSSSDSFNSGFKDIYDYCTYHELPLVIYLHAELSEKRIGSYNVQGQEIIDFAKDRNLPLVTDLFEDLQDKEFRDNIHVNQIGQLMIVNRLDSAIDLCELINPSKISR